jgi:hypothetical protein
MSSEIELITAHRSVMKSAPQALLAMRAVHRQGSRPVNFGGIGGLGRNGGLNLEIHPRSRFSPRDRFLQVATYSGQQSSATRQCVGAGFLGLHHDGPVDLKHWASESNEDRQEDGQYSVASES